jgi:hypothetical protein
MKDHLKEVLSEQRYDQLSLDEKESLNALCLEENNPEVIGTIFSVLDGLSANSTIQPRNQTKERLDYMFQSNTQTRGTSFSLEALSAFLFPPTKPLWQSRLIPIAAVVAILFIGIRFWGDDIKGVNSIGLKTAQLSDVEITLMEKNKHAKPTQPSRNIPVNKTVERATKMTSIPANSYTDDVRMDAYSTIGSYASTDLGSLAMEAEESVADKKESVSFRLADCPECMELITASY